jgi:ppGpp synthetase/RelA/SpoT-type nucleotidyltranferase
VEIIQNNISKQSIKVLGSSIRKQKREDNCVDDPTLNLLQNYRTSFKEPMSHVFKIVNEISKEEHGSNITTYRIKRFESVISKLLREPTMNLATMGDIAGCRCIVNNENTLYSIVNKLKDKFEIKSEHDYIIKPKQSGYKSYHLIVKIPNDWRTVEVQIRTDSHHNWATLLEITDLLFKVKLKEGENHPDLARFHLLRSNTEMSIQEKEEFLTLEQKLGVYTNLTEVISLNFLDVRLEWIRLKSHKNEKYFILEVDQNNKASINSYSSYLEAETEYLRKFKTSNSNIVLTHLEKPNYYFVSKAYSNYTLMKHKFEDDFFELIKDVVKYWKRKKKTKVLSSYLDYVEKIIKKEAERFEKELNKIEHSNDKEKMQEWGSEVIERIKKKSDFAKEIQKYRPSFLERLLGN